MGSDEHFPIGKWPDSIALARRIFCMQQQVRFCTAEDGVRLAYAISGKGPPLVRAPHWFTHLEHDWTNPAMRPWVEDLSRRYTLLRFDQRGTGLSDREVPDLSIEAQIHDLECVIDAAGFRSFALLGLSQGAAYAAFFGISIPASRQYASYSAPCSRRRSRSSSQMPMKMYPVVASANSRWP